jgi:Ser/Thr protein kinase RdoA (MazF antagonist)
MPDRGERLELLDKLRRFLEKHYDTTISQMTRLDQGVYRASRPGGPDWVCRVFPPERGLELVRGDAEILRTLQELGIPSERLADPNPVTSPGGRTVLITVFVDGPEPQGSEASFAWLGEAVGRILSLPPQPGAMSRDAGSLHVFVPSGGRPRAEIDAASAWLSELEGRIGPALRPSYDSLARELSTADDGRGLPDAFVHPDAVLRNVVTNPGGRLTLIDWTGAGQGPRLSAVAWSVWAAGPWDGHWSAAHIEAVVRGIRKHCELEPEELARLPNVMRVRPVLFACWRLRRAIFAGKEVTGKEWWWPDERLNEAIASHACEAFGGAGTG